MYVLWSQTNETLDFSQNSEMTPKSSIMRDNNFSSYHGNSSNVNTGGMVMVQLLRADKLEVPEKLIHTKLYDVLSIRTDSVFFITGTLKKLPSD